MRPLSSKMTFYYKRVSPVSFFGVVLLMFGFGLISVLRDRQVSNVPFLIVLLLLAVFAYRFMKKLVFNLSDEVLDAGNALVVRSTHRTVRHQERQLFALHEPAAGQPVGAVSHRVRRDNRFPRTGQYISAPEQRGHK